MGLLKHLEYLLGQKDQRYCFALTGCPDKQMSYNANGGAVPVTCDEMVFYRAIVATLHHPDKFHHAPLLYH